MKSLFVATILLFSVCSFGQSVDSSAKLKTFDRSKWVRNPSKEIVSTDGFRRWQIGSQFMCICPTGQIYIDSTVQAKAECKHIYVAVEQPEIKVEYPRSMKLAIFEAPKSGKHEGQEIVCVKCFHIRKQVIDYGEIDSTMLLTPNVRHRTPNDSLRNK